MLLYGDFQGRRTISTLLCAAGDRPQPERTTNGRPPGKICLGGVRLSEQPRLHKLHKPCVWAASSPHPFFIEFFVNFCAFLFDIALLFPTFFKLYVSIFIWHPAC